MRTPMRASTKALSWDELVISKDQQEGWKSEVSKGDADRDDLRKVIKTQMVRSPEDPGVTMSFKCNRISETEGAGPSLE